MVIIEWDIMRYNGNIMGYIYITIKTSMAGRTLCLFFIGKSAS